MRTGTDTDTNTIIAVISKHICHNIMYLIQYGRLPKFHRVFLGRDPGTLKSDIVSTKTSTINLLGFETLELTIRRLKLWKPTVTQAYQWQMVAHRQPLEPYGQFSYFQFARFQAEGLKSQSHCLFSLQHALWKSKSPRGAPSFRIEHSKTGRERGLGQMGSTLMGPLQK